MERLRKAVGNFGDVVAEHDVPALFVIAGRFDEVSTFKFQI